MSLVLRVVYHLTINHVGQNFSMFHSGAYAMRSIFRLIKGGWRNSCMVV